MSWNVKSSGAYANTSAEAIENAQFAHTILGLLGWSVNAVSGLLGNVSSESGMNPWRWQSDAIGASTGSPWTNKGYGLVQFTNAAKYIDNADAKTYPGYGPNFSDKTGSVNDGTAQLYFVHYHADYYSTTAYPLSFEQFKVSTESASYLAKAWLYNYERPADPASTEAARAANAEYWYSILSGHTVGGRLPIWLMARTVNRNRFKKEMIIK